jgi:hypothetical protein
VDAQGAVLFNTPLQDDHSKENGLWGRSYIYWKFRSTDLKENAVWRASAYMTDDVKMRLKFRHVNMSSTLSRLRMKFNGGFCEHGSEHPNHINLIGKTSSDVTIRWRCLVKRCGYYGADRDTRTCCYWDSNLPPPPSNVVYVCFNCSSPLDLAIKHLPSQRSPLVCNEILWSWTRETVKIFIPGLHAWEVLQKCSREYSISL